MSNEIHFLHFAPLHFAHQQWQKQIIVFIALAVLVAFTIVLAVTASFEFYCKQVHCCWLIQLKKLQLSHVSAGGLFGQTMRDERLFSCDV